MRQLLSFLVIFLISLTIFAQTSATLPEGGGLIVPPPPLGTVPLSLVPIGMQLLTYVERPLVIGETTSMLVNAVFFDNETGGQILQDGINILPRISDPSIADVAIVGNNQIRITAKTPGTTRLFFADPSDVTLGGVQRLNPFWDGQLLTVIGKGADYGNNQALVYPSRNFYGAGTAGMLPIIFPVSGASLGSLVLSCTNPEGQINQQVYDLRALGLTQGSSAMLPVFPWTGRGSWGRYKYQAWVYDTTGKFVSFNRFSTMLCEFPVPGRFSGPHLSYADVWAGSGDGIPSILNISGQLPITTDPVHDISIYVNGELISNYRTRSFVEFANANQIRVNVFGLDFPVADYDLLLFFHSSGEVMYYQQGMRLDFNPASWKPYPSRGYGSNSEKK